MRPQELHDTSFSTYMYPITAKEKIEAKKERVEMTSKASYRFQITYLSYPTTKRSCKLHGCSRSRLREAFQGFFACI